MKSKIKRRSLTDACGDLYLDLRLIRLTVEPDVARSKAKPIASKQVAVILRRKYEAYPWVFRKDDENFLFIPSFSRHVLFMRQSLSYWRRMLNAGRAKSRILQASRQGMRASNQRTKEKWYRVIRSENERQFLTSDHSPRKLQPSSDISDKLEQINKLSRALVKKNRQ